MRWKRPTRRGWIVAGLTGAAGLALPVLFPSGESHGWWDAVPGWWAIFGAVGCAAIVIVSKWLGHAFLQKDEDWYD